MTRPSDNPECFPIKLRRLAASRLRARQGGDALIIFVVFIVALFAMGALSIDVGNAQLQRKKIHEATDAAALAAVPEWWVVQNKSAVDAVARAFASANGISSNEIVSVKAGKWENGAFYESDSPNDVVPAVQVIAQRKVKMLFARIVGFTEMNPQVESVAVVAKALAAQCAVPFSACAGMDTTPCAELTIKTYNKSKLVDGAEDWYFTNSCWQVNEDGEEIKNAGNFGLLNFSCKDQGSDKGGGAACLAESIRSCNANPLRLSTNTPCDPGSIIYTATGNKWSSNVKGALNDRLQDPDFDCAGDPPPGNRRAVIVPKVEIIQTEEDGSGLSGVTAVCIRGFYTVRLDDLISQGKEKTVEATFVKSFSGDVVDSTLAPIPGELAGVALVK